MIWILLLSVLAGGLRSEPCDKCLRAMQHMYGPWLQHVWQTVGDGSSTEMNNETSYLPQGAQGGKCSTTECENVGFRKVAKLLEAELVSQSTAEGLSDYRASAIMLEWLPMFCFVLFFWSTLLFNTPCASNPRGFYLVFPPPSSQLHWQIRGLSCFAKGRKAAGMSDSSKIYLGKTAWTEAVQI